MGEIVAIDCDFGMVDAELGFVDRQRPLECGFHFGKAALILIDHGQIIERHRDLSAVLTAGLLGHRKGLVELRLRDVVARLLQEHGSKPGRHLDDGGVAFWQQRRHDCERLLVELFGLAIAGEIDEGVGKVVLGLKQASVVGRDILLQRVDHLLEHPGGVGVMAELVVRTREVAQGQDVRYVACAAALGGSFVSLRFRQRRGVIAG